AAAPGRSAARDPGARPGAEAAARLAARGVDPGSGGAEGGAGSVAPASGARSQAWSAEAPAPRPPGPGEDRPGSRAPPAARPSPTGSSSEAGRPSTSDAPASPSWEDLAREGRYDRAFEALARHGGITAVPDRPAALMLAADVARLSRHPEDALAPLEGVVARHARDPRAPLAAFTLGRVLLEELGRPRPAAEAFARARRLAPAGSLAEDALAREVEAWSRAGEAARARRLAEDYVARYPRGRRLSSTRRFGGLD
ncbi:MAG: tol-pal system YbgF family protein, partial [Sandaracinaceae bacterium]